MSRKKSATPKSCFWDESKNCYLRLIENSTDVFYLIDAKTSEVKYVSPASTAISGFTPEEVIKMGFEGTRQRFHPDDLETIDYKIRDILTQKKQPKNFDGYLEKRFRHKDGHWVWFGISRNFMVDKNGEIEAIVGTIRDVTEVKTLQQKLETSLNNYKALYNNARVALFRTQISDGKLLECNEALVRILGYENRQECLVHHKSTNFYADLKRRSELLAVLNEKGYIDNFEIKARRLTGELFWMRVSAAINRDENYMEGVMSDITAYKILTKTENDILAMVMEGKSNKQIAAESLRSIRTVEEHRANIMRKLGATNLVELTQKAINYGAAVQKI
ncbi:MAG: PAS domain S-box protein [Planctomycetaceae bacterium]|nr:PAS domain S-box protein [Planctomycetaceae bacterium]